MKEGNVHRRYTLPGPHGERRRPNGSYRRRLEQRDGESTYPMRQMWNRWAMLNNYALRVFRRRTKMKWWRDNEKRRQEVRTNG